jgi:IclR family pca regulon transcriptional regulator
MGKEDRVNLAGDDGAAAAVPARDANFVQSLDRGLAVIRAFDAQHPRLQLSEVARATGLTRAAARRFLLTLVQLGYVRVEGREFSLRPRVLELGYSYLSGLTLPEVAQPHLEALVGRVDESSSISVLDGDDVVYVARVHTKRIMTVMITVGTRFPAYATSMGRVLLAALPEAELAEYLARAELRPLTPRTVTDRDTLRATLEQVRAQGYALVDQELEEGLRSAAAPVHSREGAVVAAVNLSVSASRTSMRQLEDQFLPPLLETAAQISRDLGRPTPA